jgi:hypothetical protein
VKWKRGKNLLAGMIFVLLIWLIYPAFIALGSEQTGESCEKKRGLVILVEFPDIVPPVDEAFVRDRFKKLDVYVREMSYGRYARTSISRDGTGS